MPAAEESLLFLCSKTYKNERRSHQDSIKSRVFTLTEIRPFHPPGHFYSPINDVNTLSREALEFARTNKQAKDVLGVQIDDEEMQRLWESFSHYLARFPFDKEAGPNRRFYLDNPFFGPGDAFILYSMIIHAQPSRVVEIGSGFSSACLLDTIELEGLTTQCTFIEPYPQRLKSLLARSDLDRCTVMEEPVQNVDPEFFLSLGAGDILFIDSTHVLKACSDVAFELFEVLPRLRPGVFVHFHDMFWPFEYPTGWLIDKQYSWNELYAVRAFLINNDKFKVVFFNDYFHRRHVDLIANSPLPVSLRGMRLHCGGSLWIQRI